MSLPKGIVTSQTLSAGDPFVLKSLTIADKHLKKLQSDLKTCKDEPRMIAILLHIMMEYYVNEILIVRGKMNKHNDKVKYSTKLVWLSKEPEISKKLIKSLKIQLQNVKDLAEAIATFDEVDEDMPNSDIFEIVNNMMMSESLEMLDELNQNLVQIK